MTLTRRDLLKLFAVMPAVSAGTLVVKPQAQASPYIAVRTAPTMDTTLLTVLALSSPDKPAARTSIHPAPHAITVEVAGRRCVISDKRDAPGIAITS